MRRRDHGKRQAVESEKEIERRAKILSVGAKGDGVAEGPIYVPFALPGEQVRVAVSGERGRILDIDKESPERVEAICRHFETCGGCTLQHWRRPVYLAWKRDVVVEALERAGVEAEVASAIDGHGAGRRRATFHGVRAKSVGVVFGYAKRGSHEVFAIEECPVLVAPIARGLPRLRKLAERLLPLPGRVDIQVTATDGGLDIDARGSRAEDDQALRADLAALAEQGDWARLTIAGEPIISRKPATLRMGEAVVEPPPGGFLQATVVAEATLASLVDKGVGEARLAADLYCGVGAFALRLASRMAVDAIDGDAAAVAAVKRAASRAQGLKPVAAIRRDLARAPLAAKELAKFDAVVLDPPRVGADAQCRAIAASKVGRVVMVSCNPATFARDAKTLVDAGFRLDPVTPVDQFLWTPHVELVGVFRR